MSRIRVVAPHEIEPAYKLEGISTTDEEKEDKIKVPTQAYVLARISLGV